MAEDGEKAAAAAAVGGVAGGGGEGEEREEQSVKLFVGQVPKHMTEAELAAMFKEVALVDEVTVIKDKATKASRGACGSDRPAGSGALPRSGAMPPGEFGLVSRSRCSLAPKVFESFLGFLFFVPCFAAVLRRNACRRRDRGLRICGVLGFALPRSREISRRIVRALRFRALI